MGEIKALIGIMFLIVQIPIVMILAVKSSLVLKFPLLALFPLTGLGIMLLINSSTPPIIKR